MKPDLSQSIANLLKALNKTDATMASLDKKSKAIQAKYDPVTLARSQFKNWSKSHNGRTWKKQQFKLIGGVCPKCSNSFNHARYFQIDHIEPLSKHPELALTLSNLQLLCGPCNNEKNNS